MIDHPIPPVYDGTSTVLILGSFPSVRSREEGFFYGHPQNRFWRVIAAVCGEPIPCTVQEKKRLLLTHHIALWDVIASCEIDGSADSTIRGAVPTDLARILTAAPIGRICTNGRTADAYYRRYQQPLTGLPAVCLPSTSAANAAWSLDRLIAAWRQIIPDTEK